MNTIQIILTSSVISGVISAIISYFFSLKIKKLDFRNEYYKTIINKRMEVYKFVENQVATLKTVVLGDDKKPYHIIFAYGEEKFIEFQQNLSSAISNSIWIDDDTMKTLESLNNLFFSLNNKVHKKTKMEIETLGKEYYKKISDLRFNLENNLKRGLFDLPNVEKIFKTKETNKTKTIYNQ